MSHLLQPSIARNSIPQSETNAELDGSSIRLRPVCARNPLAVRPLVAFVTMCLNRSD